jgi:hypothetical protein
MLTAIYSQGFLTADLVALAFFPEPPGGRRSPCSSAYERLQRLWHWSFLERLEPPIARSLGGRRPHLYALGRGGEPVAAERLGGGAAPVRRRRLDRLDSLFVGHDLTIAAFWANLVATLRATRVALERWLPERELRARRMRVRDPRGGRWLPFLPDAAFELRYPSGAVQCGLLEVDMGTLTLPRTRRKLRAFELALAAGLAGERLQLEDFEVLVLTHSAARLDHRWGAARREVAEERWECCSFATFGVLDPDRLDDVGAWVNLGEDTTGLPYTEAYEAEQGTCGPSGERTTAPTAGPGGNAPPGGYRDAEEDRGVR